MTDYSVFCSYRSRFQTNAVLDLSDVTFLRPTTVLPLAALIKKERPKIRYPRDFAVRAYLETVTDSSRFEKNGWNSKSYLPCVPLPNQQDKAESILQWIYRKHDDGKECGGENAFKFLIGELVDNIYEHSEFSSSWVIAQAYKNAGYMDICFFDDGVTINGCFKKHGIECAEDYEAIIKAISGVSTKGQERGYGLSSNMKIFTEGVHGQILIVSGSGGYQNSLKEPHQSYPFGKPYELSGTMISVRIPYPAPVVNIFEYLEE
ncbi:MAG: hypothetical protein ACXADO_06380 [Candidatus Thorarchaeota archaeon]|jgi:hypothetical protein